MAEEGRGPGEADERERPGGVSPEPEGVDAGLSGEGDEGPGLEERLRRLEEIVSLLEAEEVELDRALALFEEGVAHVRAAEKILSEAELRVEELLGEGDDARTRPLVDDGETG